MATSSITTDESPLIAALPPNTDYITYLTILEYQLTPQNLHILNGFLQSDDGTLAKEIGWDLLRLVLPMLIDGSSDARKCLDIIAQRGNPREVVVRIAEELEKLGRNSDDSDDDEGEEEDDGSDDRQDADELRTFSGEASRIHLGEMKLDGMPPSDKSLPPQQPEEEDQSETLADTPSHLHEAAVFLALMSMLSIVHPRIKTQYPSRFLATSLPAALTAYRRMPITTATTEAFLVSLEKLGGKQRPPLPDRRSTAERTGNATRITTLPDPEAPSEAAEGTNIAGQLERDIIARLLQAVMLEVLDEYIASLQGDDIQSLMWTKRWRETIEPQRLVPGRPSTSDVCAKLPYRSRDTVLLRFVSLATTLKLDGSFELDKITQQNTDTSEGTKEETEPSEYPTSPSHIPVPTTGTLLMLAVLRFFDQESYKPLDLLDIAKLFEIISPLSDMPKIPNAGIQDALHSLLLQTLTTEDSSCSLLLDDQAYIDLFSTLTQTSTITPDPQSRDDAHFLATKLLHRHPSPDLRVELIKQTINCTTPPPTSIPLATPFTEGALKAVGVNWLKDELLLSLSPSGPKPTGTGIENNTPATPANKDEQNTQPEQQDLPVSLLTSDEALANLIFHPSVPTISPSNDTHLELLPQLLPQLPYYISLLNLCVIIVSRLLPRIDSDHELREGLFKQCRALFETIHPRREILLEILSAAGGTDNEAELVQGSVSDIFALDDAVGRLEEALRN